MITPPPLPPDIVEEIFINDPRYSQRADRSRTKVLRYIVTEEGLQEAKCADEIVHAESRWNDRSINVFSGAWGLFQLMHKDKKWNVIEQTKLAVAYAKHRYDGFCSALNERKKKGWW